MVKNPPAVQETQVRSLGLENPLEKGIATHSSILAWRIPWISGRPQSMRSQRVGHDSAENNSKDSQVGVLILLPAPQDRQGGAPHRLIAQSCLTL